MATTTVVQIRNVPKELHRRLKARAAMEGLSMSDYAMRVLRKSLEVPTRQEILERLQARPRVHLKLKTVDILRQDRKSH